MRLLVLLVVGWLPALVAAQSQTVVRESNGIHQFPDGVWLQGVSRCDNVSVPATPTSGQVMYCRVGGGWCAKDSSGTERCTGAGGGGGYATILDEAAALTARTTLNFTGAGVTCVDNGGASRTDCTIPGGGGGGTVTSVDCGAGLTCTPDPIVGAGTIVTNLADGQVPNILTLDLPGGTLTGITNDAMLMGTAAGTGAYIAMPVTGTNGCADPNTDKLLYNTATNTWSCGTDQTGGAGSGDIEAVGNCGSGLCFQTTAANLVFAGPASGGATLAAMRGLVNADMPGGTTGITWKIDSDAAGTEPASGAGLEIEGGSGDVSLLWDSGNDELDLAGPGAISLNVPRLNGAGLVDCDVGATSKLLWDAATKQFSCGTDTSGGGAGTVTSVDCGAGLTCTPDPIVGAGTIVVGTGGVTDGMLANNYSGVGACGANQWASTLNDNAAPTCTQPAFSNISGSVTDAQVPDTITAANYLPLAGGTLTGNLVLSADANEGVSGGGLADCDTEAQVLGWDATTNKFVCTADAGAGGGMTSWTAAGDTGTPQSITDGQTLSVVGTAAGIDTVASATDTLTVSFDPTEINDVTSWGNDTDNSIRWNYAVTGNDLATRVQEGGFFVDGARDAPNTVSVAVSNTGTGDAVLHAASSNADAVTQHQSGVQVWTTGVDQSAASGYAIAVGNTLGTTNVLACTVGGVCSFPDTDGVTIAGPVIASGGALITCSGCITDANVADSVTASNYVLKAGDTMTGPLLLDNAQEVRFGELTAHAGSEYTALKAPVLNLSANLVYELPSDAPGDGEQLTWNTGGTLSWEPADDVLSTAFNAITSGVNTSATMTVSTGAEIAATGTGIVEATKVGDAPAGDDIVLLWDDDTVDWATGIDDSDGDSWTLSEGTALGTNDRIVVSASTDRVTLGGLGTDLTQSAAFSPLLDLNPNGTFTAGTTETRNIVQHDAAVTSAPSGAAVHESNFLSYAPTIASASAGGVAITRVRGLDLNPTVTMATNLSFTGVRGAGTWINTAAATFGSWTLFQAGAALESNTSGIAPYPPLSFNSGNTAEYDVSSGSATLADVRDYVALSSAINRQAGGTFTVTNMTQYNAGAVATEYAGTLNVTTRTGLKVPDITVNLVCDSGSKIGELCTTDNTNASTGCPGAACPNCCDVQGPTVTTNLGVDIDAMTKGTTNVGLRNAAPTVNTPSTAQTIGAGGAILCNATEVQIQATGSVTTSTTAAIANGQPGQICIIINVDTDADTVTVKGATAANMRLKTAGADFAMGTADTLTVTWNATLADWVELSRSEF